MEEVVLTAEEEAEAARILDNAMAQARVELKGAVRKLVSRKNSEFFGEMEFQLRDAVHRVAARVLDGALLERKKRGTKDRA